MAARRRSSRRSLRAFDASRLPSPAGSTGRSTALAQALVQDCFSSGGIALQLVLVAALQHEHEGERVLCVTGQRNLASGTIAFGLHMAGRQTRQSPFALVKTWALDQLSHADGVEVAGLTLRFDEGSVHYTWTLESALARDEVLWCLLQLATRHLGRPPLSGADLVALGALATAQDFRSRYDLTETNALVEHPVGLSRGSSSQGALLPSLLSETEEASLLELLRDENWHQKKASELERGLEARAAELERSNVDTLLRWELQVLRPEGDSDSAPTIAVAQQLEVLERELAETEAWLGSQRAQLDSMAGDIGQIEADNAALEVQAGNHRDLMTLVSGIVQGAGLSGSAEIVLADLPGELRRLEDEDESGRRRERVLDAARELQRALEACKDSSNPMYSMSAMAERRGALQQLQQAFSNHVVQHLEERLVRLVENPERKGRFAKPMDLARRARSSASSRRTSGDAAAASRSISSGVDARSALRTSVQVPDNRELHRVIMHDEGLARVLLPEALARVKGAYIASLQPFYISSIRTFFSTLEQIVTRAPRQCRLSSLPLASLDNSMADMAAAKAEHDQLYCAVSPDDALEFSLSNLFPLIVREQNFLRDFFAGPLTDELEGLFTKLSKRLEALAKADEHSDELHLLALILTVDTHLENAQQVDCPFLANALIGLQLGLKTAFNRYVAEQEAWCSATKGDIKRVGVLAQFRKFPSLVDRVQLVTRGAEVEITAASYNKLVRCLFTALERAAATNPKYSDVVRLENYWFFAASLSARNVPALAGHVAQAQAHYDAALGRYAESAISYQFPAATAFFVKVEEQLAALTVEDVQYHVPIALFKRMLVEHAKNANGCMGKLHARIDKHMCAEAGLLASVFRTVVDKFLQTYERYEELARLCYDKTMAPTGQELRAQAEQW